MYLSRTVSEIDGDFRRKWKNFPSPTPSILRPAEGVLPGIGYRRWDGGGQKLE